MDNKSHIEKKVQEAFDSLDGLQPVSPAPFFYTRLTSRLVEQESNVWEVITRLLSRPVISVAAILLLVLLNTFVVIRKDASFHYVRSDQQETAFVDQYKQVNSFYDVENSQP